MSHVVENNNHKIMNDFMSNEKIKHANNFWIYFTKKTNMLRQKHDGKTDLYLGLVCFR